MTEKNGGIDDLKLETVSGGVGDSGTVVLLGTGNPTGSSGVATAVAVPLALHEHAGP